MEHYLNQLERDRRLIRRHEIRTPLRIVALCMPEEVIGEEADEWRCIGRVVRVERIESTLGKLGVGVRFDCYEVARAERRRLAKNAKLHQRVTIAP